MNRSYQRPPTLEAFEGMAQDAFDALPNAFKKLCGNVVIHVADIADDETLRALEIRNPLELSGLFEGVDLKQRGVSNPYSFPNHVHLYRQPIIAEWRGRGDVSLQALIFHVLVHEIGHHFGLSDAEMHAIEEEAG